MPIERRDMASAKLRAQCLQHRAAGETEHDVKVGELARPDISRLLTARELCQRHRGIEVVEYRNRARRIANERARYNAVGTV